MRNVFNIPWTERECIPCMPIVNMFIEWARANNYPYTNTDELVFEKVPHTALCSTLDTDESSICTCAEEGYFENEKKDRFLDDDEYFDRFEGGWVLQRYKMFHVYVDGHLYFFDF